MYPTLPNVKSMEKKNFLISSIVWTEKQKIRFFLLAVIFLSNESLKNIVGTVVSLLKFPIKVGKTFCCQPKKKPWKQFFFQNLVTLHRGRPTELLSFQQLPLTSRMPYYDKWTIVYFFT